MGAFAQQLCFNACRLPARLQAVTQSSLQYTADWDRKPSNRNQNHVGSHLHP